MPKQKGYKYWGYILITVLIVVCTYGCAPENANIESPNNQDNTSNNDGNTESKLTYEYSSEQESSTGKSEPDSLDSSVDAASEQDSHDSSIDAASERGSEVQIVITQMHMGVYVGETAPSDIFTDKETVNRILSYIDEFTEMPFTWPADGVVPLSIEITTDEGTTLYYIYPQNYAILFQGDERTWYSMPDETFLYAAKLIGVESGYDNKW